MENIGLEKLLLGENGLNLLRRNMNYESDELVHQPRFIRLNTYLDEKGLIVFENENKKDSYLDIFYKRLYDEMAKDSIHSGQWLQ